MSTTTQATRERPILFSGEMVRAILEGRKTQTRRVVKWRSGRTRPWISNDPASDTDPNCIAYHGVKPPAGPWPMENTDDGMCPVECPHGEPGDRLWVKETHQIVDYMHTTVAVYRADRPNQVESWRPSIFMRRMDSRLTLEIVSVRVERLQDITEDDAKAEGVKPVPFALASDGNALHRIAYKDLWDSLNAARGFGWDANPWAWVIEFRKV